MKGFSKMCFLGFTVVFLVSFRGSVHADDVDVKLPSSNGADSFQVKDSDDQVLMHVDSKGSVGIGVLDPAAPLHVSYGIVVGSAAQSSAFVNLGNSAGYVQGMTLSSASRDLLIGYSNPTLSFRTNKGPRMTIDNLGNVGIGNQTPAYKLDVNGDINTTGEIRKNGTAYDHPDYVFEPGYALMPLEDLKDFVEQTKHLPGMPSAAQVREEGVRLFEQNRLVLEKLEEAYLYIIELQNRVEELERANES